MYWFSQKLMEVLLYKILDRCVMNYQLYASSVSQFQCGVYLPPVYMCHDQSSAVVNL